MKRLLLIILFPIIVFAGSNAPVNYDTSTHAIKKPPTSPITTCDLDFGTLNVCGLSGSGIGTVTSITATSPIIVTPSPITSTGVISFDASGFEVPITASKSITRTTNDFALTNDSATPGNSKYYGTDSGGTRGFFDLPSGVHKITFVVDGAGGVLQTGTKNLGKILEGGTLQGWLLVGKPSGSVTVDVFRAADGAGLPVTSIIGGGGTKPALSSGVENSSTSFTGWTSTTLTAKDNLAISLSGVTTTTYCAITLYYQ